MHTLKAAMMFQAGIRPAAANLHTNIKLASVPLFFSCSLRVLSSTAVPAPEPPKRPLEKYEREFVTLWTQYEIDMEWYRSTYTAEQHAARDWKVAMRDLV
ncbi:hypothetical protein GGF31_005721 [Allomyces arbusculus]|nr:hypothetical protein GGF31_005721 [Allomyces arbusculus]